MINCLGCRSLAAHILRDIFWTAGQCHLWLAGHWGCIPNGDHCLCGLGSLCRFLSNSILLKLKRKKSVEVSKTPGVYWPLKTKSTRFCWYFRVLWLPCPASLRHCMWPLLGKGCTWCGFVLAQLQDMEFYCWNQRVLEVKSGWSIQSWCRC